MPMRGIIAPPRRQDKHDLYLNRRRLFQVPQLLVARLGVDPSRTRQDLRLVSGLVLPQPNYLHVLHLSLIVSSPPSGAVFPFLPLPNPPVFMLLSPA